MNELEQAREEMRKVLPNLMKVLTNPAFVEQLVKFGVQFNPETIMGAIKFAADWKEPVNQEDSLQDVIQRHIRSSQSVEELFQRVGTASELKSQVAFTDGLKRALEVINNSEGKRWFSKPRINTVMIDIIEKLQTTGRWILSPEIQRAYETAGAIVSREWEHLVNP